MGKVIPIFPLQVVVYPESTYPLHIFEERYKIMINECLSNNSNFGIVASIDGKMQKIGSLVHIDSILKRYDDGRLDISVIGKGRFTILETKRTQAGYLSANIEFYTDIADDRDDQSVRKLKSKFKKFIQKYDLEVGTAFWKNYEIRYSKSYKIAEKAGLKLEQQQVLLSYRHENDRIKYLSEHLNRFEKEMSEKMGLRRIVIGDGFLDK